MYYDCITNLAKGDIIATVNLLLRTIKHQLLLINYLMKFRYMKSIKKIYSINLREEYNILEISSPREVIENE